MFRIYSSLLAFSIRYYSSFFFWSFSFYFSFFILSISALFSSGTYYFFSNILCRSSSFSFIFCFSSCSILSSYSLFLSSSYSESPFYLLSPPTVRYTILSVTTGSPDPLLSIWIGIRPSSIAFSNLIYSDISLS